MAASAPAGPHQRRVIVAWGEGVGCSERCATPAPALVSAVLVFRHAHMNSWRVVELQWYCAVVAMVTSECACVWVSCGGDAAVAGAIVGVLLAASSLLVAYISDSRSFVPVLCAAERGGVLPRPQCRERRGARQCVIAGAFLLCSCRDVLCPAAVIPVVQCIHDGVICSCAICVRACDDGFVLVGGAARCD